MNLKDFVEKIFYNLLVSYQLKIVEVDKTEVQLYNSKITIRIAYHLSELYVIIRVNNEEIGINPLLWAYTLNKIHFKEIVPQTYLKHLMPEDFLRISLSMQYTYICLFCKDLLDADFSRVSEYKEKSRSVSIEINEHFLNLYKSKKEK